MITEIKDNKIHLLIEREIYTEDVLYKCFYWYGANFYVDISISSADKFSVILQSKNESENLQTTLEKVKKDLIDFKLRDIVTKETKTVRELIVAKAFAYYEFDENPVTEISDPVGFNPESVKVND